MTKQQWNKLSVTERREVLDREWATSPEPMRVRTAAASFEQLTALGRRFIKALPSVS